MDSTGSPRVEPSEAQTSEVEQVLYQLRCELFALVVAGETGTLTTHVGPNHIVVEVNRKLAEVKRKQKPVTPARKSWG